MTTVVVGVDGSDASLAALRWASAVAAASGAALRVVSSWQYASGAGSPFGRSALPSPPEMDRETAGAVRVAVGEVLGAGDEVDIEVRRGPAADVLLEQVRATGASMLVLGARGLGGFDGLLLGSVTQQCVEHSPCPVVVIRGEPEQVVAPPSKILVGLDGSDGSRRALEWALDVAAPSGASVVAAHSVGVDVPVAARARVQAEAEGSWTEPIRARGLDHVVRVADGDPRSVIDRLSEDEQPDLVVVGSRGLGPVRGLLLGSVAGYLVRYAGRPIAVVPPGAR